MSAERWARNDYVDLHIMDVDHEQHCTFCSVEQAVESDVMCTVMLYSHVHNLRLDLQLLPDQTDE